MKTEDFATMLGHTVEAGAKCGVAPEDIVGVLSGMILSLFVGPASSKEEGHNRASDYFQNVAEGLKNSQAV